MMKKNLKRFGILCLPFAMTACTASSGGNLQEVVNQHSQAIQQLQAQVSGVQPAQADSWSQVQSLRQEMATLKGDLDNLNNSTAHLGGVPQLGNIIARHERALRLIESQMGLTLQLDDPNAVPYTGGMPEQKTPNAGMSAPAPAPLPNQSTPAVNTPTTTTPPATTQTPPKNADTAQALYDSGINNFNNRNYANALNSFIDFTKVYPSHALVSNAWFWQGESHYQMKNYAAAALAYDKVITGFPNSIKAPASYLKQGMAFQALGRNDAAKERLTYLVNNYPKAPESKRASQVLKNL